MPLHPWVADRVHHLHAMPGLGGFDTEAGGAEWRAFSRVDEYEAPAVQVRVTSIPRPNPADGSLRVLIYSPAGRASGVGLVWSHGGGFAGGDVSMFEADGVARELVSRTGGVVVSVDYRLVTETVRYPAPTDDVRLAWEWTRATAAELGIDASRLNIGGASAGAALTAAVVVAIRDDGAPLPARTVLAYPIVHPTLPPLPHELARKLRDVPDILNYSLGDHRRNGSVEALLGGPLWWSTSHVMAGLADLEGYPPTAIVNSEYDALRSSGQQFAAQLALAGVDVTVRNEPGVLHGHLNIPPVLEPVDNSLRWIAATLLG